MITKTIAQIFRDIAKILEIKGENVFRIRAYERAAANVESLSEDIQDLINDGSLTDIPGIGEDLAEKIKEIVKTGRLQFFESLKKTIPEGLLELLNIPSVGPKTARLFYEKLKIKSVSELEKAAKGGSLLKLEGIKEKTIENILKGIGLLKQGQERMDLAKAASCASELMKGLKEKIRGIKQLSACGSLRRMKETVRDIDILAVSDSPEEVMRAFTGLPQVKDITAQGATKSSIITKENAQVDLRVVEAKSFGAALLYFTGSKNFNIKLRQRAVKKGLKLNEYGVFAIDKGRETYLCGRTEEEVFKSLGLAYIAPELREDTGEIELAAKNKLPRLVALEDIKGDLHAHSEYSDGNNSILEMARAARELGYEYLNMSDHSQGLKVAGGLSAQDLKKKRAEVDNLNSKLKGFKVLFGSEVDIDSEGRLDYPDKILSGFDCVVAAIHSGFKQSKSQLTKRLINACKNKHV
ncbi:PHP domain-containing protein, partial [bacterium]